MKGSESHVRTPARGAQRSAWARAHLLQRLRRLALPPAALPRLLRFLEEEVHQALETQRQELFSAEEVEEAGGAELLAALGEARQTRERIAAIQAAGISDLSPEELEQVLAEVRVGGDH